LPENPRPKKAGAGASRRGIRTDGAPRLVAPGGRGNPSARFWSICYSAERRSRAVSTGETDARRAKDFLTQWLAARAAGAPALTIGDVLDRYVQAKRKDHERKGRAPGVTSNLEGKIGRLRPHFGALKPGALSAGYIDTYIDAERARGLADTSITSSLAYLRAALIRAERRREIDKAPSIHTPGGARARKRALTRRELPAFTRALADPATPLHLRAYVTLALMTGQRGRHIRPLLWRDVDFAEGVIWFSRSNPDAAENKRVQDVPMTDALIALLTALRTVARTPYVLEWEDRPIKSVRTAWRSLIRRAGLPDLQLRDLRRSVATLAVEGGASMTAVAALLNNDEAITRRHYAQVSGLLLDVLGRVDLGDD